MRRIAVFLLSALFPLLSATARAQENPAAEAPKKAEKPEKAEPPRAEKSVTSHSVVIGGVTVAYTATAGTLIVRNEKDEPWASMGYVAYVRKDSADAGRRPVTFAYNGGPGSSSIWLHMGALGPKRIVVSDAEPTPPPPYRLVDNASSILDKTDLVMIDPVGTGISRAVGGAKEKDFWGVDPDIDSVARFIRQWVTENGRWNSPKYLLGESYGTTRSAGVVEALQSRYGMSFNGVILVSVALDLEAIFNGPGNDRPFPLFLPTYAATAWYHKLLPSRPEKLEPFLDEVRGLRARSLHVGADEGGRARPGRAGGGDQEAPRIHRPLRGLPRQGGPPGPGGAVHAGAAPGAQGRRRAARLPVHRADSRRPRRECGLRSAERRDHARLHGGVPPVLHRGAEGSVREDLHDHELRDRRDRGTRSTRRPGRRRCSPGRAFRTPGSTSPTR